MHDAARYYPITYLYCENDQHLPLHRQQHMVMMHGSVFRTATFFSGHSLYLSQPEVVLKKAQEIVDAGVWAEHWLGDGSLCLESATWIVPCSWSMRAFGRCYPFDARAISDDWLARASSMYTRIGKSNSDKLYEWHELVGASTVNVAITKQWQENAAAVSQHETCWLREQKMGCENRKQQVPRGA